MFLSTSTGPYGDDGPLVCERELETSMTKRSGREGGGLGLGGIGSRDWGSQGAGGSFGGRAVAFRRKVFSVVVA